MDTFKKETIKDYTAYDLNCPDIVQLHNRQEWEAMIKRKARRKAARELNELLKSYSGLLSRMKERDSDEELNDICDKLFIEELRG